LGRTPKILHRKIKYKCTLKLSSLLKKYQEKFVLKRSRQKRAPNVSSATRIYRIFFVQYVEIFDIAHIDAIMTIGKNIKNTAWEN